MSANLNATNHVRIRLPGVPVEHLTHDTVPDSDADLRELLSERLLADFPVAVWRDVFLGSGAERVAFLEQYATLVCCDSAQPDWADADFEALSTRFGGHFEGPSGSPVFRFTAAEAALATALFLQRTCAPQIRVALLTGRITTAHLELSGEAKALTIGAPIEGVRTLMRKAVPGSIKMCPVSYLILATAIDRQAKGAMVTTEYGGDRVMSALLTLPPTRSSEYSTFAGLGLDVMR